MSTHWRDLPVRPVRIASELVTMARAEYDLHRMQNAPKFALYIRRKSYSVLVIGNLRISRYLAFMHDLDCLDHGHTEEERFNQYSSVGDQIGSYY